jgi:hypothetical protein
MAQTAVDRWIPITVNSSALTGFSNEDKAEQLRDWALMAAAVATGQSMDTYRDLFYRVPLLHEDLLRPLYQNRAGQYRWLPLPNGRELVLMPDGQGQDLTRVGRLADEYAVANGNRPGEVLIFEYLVNEAAPSASIRGPRAVPGSTLYSADAGFAQSTIRTVDDLEKYLVLNLDLVEVTHRGTDMILGGRQLSAAAPRLMTAGDVAVLQAADKGLMQSFQANMHDRLRSQYDQLIDETALKALHSDPQAYTEASYAELQKLRDVVRQVNPYVDFERKAVDAAAAVNAPTIGFSLDPRQNYTGIGADLELLLTHPKQLFTGALLNQYAINIQMEDKAESASFKKLLEELKRMEAAGDQGPKIGPERNAMTLIGLEETPAPAKTESEESLTIDEAQDQAREHLESVAAAAQERRAVIQNAAEALKAGNSGPYTEFRRYLAGEELDVSIRKDSPKYQVKDLQAMLVETGADIEADGLFGPKTTEAVKDYQTEFNLDADTDKKLRTDGVVDGKTWRSLLEMSNDTGDDLDNLRVLLDDLETKNNRQCARYDGALAGTGPGMTMFYTDLLMKLWSFAYQKSLPAVAGFIPETRSPVDRVYWDEMRRYPDTRGWLSGQPASVGYSGDTVRFAPVATRLYNASSNPLFNGAEVPANYSSERFSSWWNAHYWEVADYEPQYHRLNQIMKWSAVLTSFKDEPPAVLNAIAGRQPAATLRFDTWWPAQADLKVHVTTPFVTAPGERTECLAILQSDLYESMGGLWQFSGGVNTFRDTELADRKLSEAHRPAVPELVRQSDLDNKDFQSVQRVKVTGQGAYDLSAPKVARFEADAALASTTGARGEQARGFLTNTETSFSGDARSLLATSKAGTTEMYRVAIEPQGTGLHVDAQPGGFVQAVEFARGNGETGAAAGQDWVRVEIKDGFLLKKNFSDQWTLFTTDSRNPLLAKRAVKANVAVGEKVYSAAPLAARETEPLMRGTAWVELPTESGLGGMGGDDGATVLTFGEADPDDVKFTLRIGDSRVTARTAGDRLQVQLPSDLKPAQEAAAQLRRNIDADAASAFYEFGTSTGRRSAAHKLGNGQIVYASMGEEADADTAMLGTLLRDAGDHHTVIVRDTAEGGVRFDPHGTLEIPPDAKEPQIATARSMLALTDRLPDLKEEVYKLGEVTAEDAAVLPDATKDGAEAYLEMRSIDGAKLQGTALLDLRVSDGNPRAAFRTADHAGFRPAGNHAGVLQSYQYVEGLMTGANKGDTVAQFRAKSKPLFDYVKSAAADLGAGRIVTLENADFDMDTFVSLHGGIPGVRFVRDIPDMEASLQHAAAPVPIDPGKWVVASTVPLNGLKCDRCAAAQAALGKLANAVTDFDRPLAWSEFRDLLDEDLYEEITLVARAKQDGLEFADQWVSSDRIAIAMAGSLVKTKKMLHLVTNGGAKVESAFADSGRFDRVVMSRYLEGDPDSFAGALEDVVRWAEAPGRITLSAPADDVDELRVSSPLLAEVLTGMAKRDGDQLTVPLADYVAEVERRDPKQSETGLSAARDWLRTHRKGAASVTLDELFEQVKQQRTAADGMEVRNAAVELRAVPLIKND